MSIGGKRLKIFFGICCLTLLFSCAEPGIKVPGSPTQNSGTVSVVDTPNGSISSQVAKYNITYNLANPGQVSINVYDPLGHVVRELKWAEKQSAGVYSVEWDGKDRNGNDVSNAASCTWKLLSTPNGLTAEYLMSLGTSYVPGTEWWAMGPGSHDTPGAVAVDDSGVYIAAKTTENVETALLKQSIDGTQRIWSSLQPDPWDGARALAVFGGVVYMLGNYYSYDDRITQYGLNAGFYWNPQTVWKYNAANGTRSKDALPISGNNPGAIDVRWDRNDENRKNDLDATDMDVNGSIMVVAFLGKDGVRFYDTSTGGELRTLTVSSPQGVSLDSNGIVYASSGNKIVKIVGNSVSDFITGLESPTLLDIDHFNGTLLVFQAGSSRQILRYRLSDKILLNTYGQAGGRSVGLYDSNAQKSFSLVNDLTADGAGGIFVADGNGAPRRVAHFDNQGDLIKEWYGGTIWAPNVMVDPDDPTTVWMVDSGQEPGIMRIKVDYVHRTWSVHSIYNYYSLPNNWFNRPDPPRFELIKHDGITFIAPLYGNPRILRVDEQNWKLLPVTICDNVWNVKSNTTPQKIQSWASSNKSYQWNDLNSDGDIQQNEVMFYPLEMSPTLTCGPHIDKNGEFYMLDSGVSAVSDGTMFRRQVTWRDGIPFYQMPGATPLFTTPARMRGPSDSRYSIDSFHDTMTGTLYCGMNVNITGWCTSSDSFLSKWNQGSTEMWEVGKKGDEPGQINHFRRFLGMTHGCEVLLNVSIEGDPDAKGKQLISQDPRNRSYVWDSDGLWVGGLMDTIVTTNVSKYFYLGGAEWLSGTMYTDPVDGTVYAYLDWLNEARVYKITGWDNWERQSGIIDVQK